MKTLAEAEKEYILSILEEKRGNRTQAARALDIGLRTLQRKLQQYGVPNGVAGVFGGKGRKGEPVHCVSTGVTYPSVKAAAIDLATTSYVVNRSLMTGKPVKDLLFKRPNGVEGIQ